jgi:type I restriction enzyme S subunit
MIYLFQVRLWIFLNQYTNEPRERDYGFAGSFYGFAIWIGLGVAAIYDGADDQFIYPDLMMKIRLSTCVDAQYVHLWLISEDARDYFRRHATGTQGTMPKVNQSVVSMTPIPLPPAREQARIVARVTDLRRLCADLRQRLAASQATQSRLAEALVKAATA